MSHRLPPLNALRSFEAAGRHLSFTRAAQELFVTHGAISRQVQALEAWLGTPLFRRFNRRLELTDTGRAYLEEVGAALARIAEATSRLEATSRARVLTVNASSSFTLLWLMPRLAAFRLQHPAIELRLVQSNTPVDRAALGSGVAIRNGPPPWPGLEARPFLDSACTPVCAPALLKRSRLESPRALSRHTLLHARSAPESWPDWLHSAGVAGLQPRDAIHFDHFYFALQAAVDGLGIAMGPTPFVAADLASGRLVAPFPERTVPAQGFYVLHAARPSPGPELRAFCDWLESEGRAATAPLLARSAR